MVRYGMFAWMAAAIGSTAACGSSPTVNTKDYSIGPFVSVKAYDTGTGAKQVSVSAGMTARLAVTAYSATDSVGVANATWTTRDTRVATNLGSTVSALASGKTYVVAQVNDSGRVLSDSVSITVTGPP